MNRPPFLGASPRYDAPLGPRSTYRLSICGPWISRSPTIHTHHSQLLGACRDPPLTDLRGLRDTGPPPRTFTNGYDACPLPPSIYLQVARPLRMADLPLRAPPHSIFRLFLLPLCPLPFSAVAWP